MKSANWISATGRSPPIAAPIDVPLLALELFHPELPLPVGRTTELPVRTARGSPPLLHLLYGALLI